MADSLDRVMTRTPEQSADVEADVAKAHEVARWLESLGPVGPHRDVGAPAADLSDQYVAAATYRRQLDTLPAFGPDDGVVAAETAIDVVTELRHMAWHIRSVTPRLERLATALDPEDTDEARPAVPESELVRAE